MASLNTINYALQKNGDASVLSGVKNMNFDSNGNLVIECNDGKILTRQFLDIKEIKFENDTDGNKHLKVEYTTGTIVDLGIIDPKFDISQLISMGTSADEATATTPLFINIGESSGSDSGAINSNNVANSSDLNNLWRD